jgi:hypothetical protein
MDVIVTRTDDQFVNTCSLGPGWRRRAEQHQFDTARVLQWSGGCAVVAASLLIGLAVRVGRTLWAVVSFFVAGLAGLGVFFAAFSATGGLPIKRRVHHAQH